ncbi:MAG: sigma-70 family RNA polymerase sigma factor [Chloroflexi bacterium]|nr:sigma-70 family RNA polymerase sigma factor [Chloroflexota bacterium]
MFLMVLPDIVDENALLRRLRQGEEAAVIETYERYFSPLYHYAHLKLGNRDQAQDIVSEVFVKLIESLGRPSAPRENLRGWLFSVARHQISRTYGERPQLPLDDVEDWMSATDSNPELFLSETIPLERVRHALRMLTADHQEVLILRFGQRLSMKETADIMGKSVSAIKSLQFRALDTLRLILTEPEATNG